MTKTFQIRVTDEPAERGDRNTVGGWPHLDPGQSVPVCECGTRMVLFFQLHVPESVPYFGGDQLVVFQCPVDDGVPYFDGVWEKTTTPGVSIKEVPAGYWDSPPEDQRFYRILLQRNALPGTVDDPYLQPRRLNLTETDDNDPDEPDYPVAGFKVGGKPSWICVEPAYRCSCGAELEFLCFQPECESGDWEPKNEDHDSQVMVDGIFLGNAVFFLACPNHCHPAAVFAECQN